MTRKFAPVALALTLSLLATASFTYAGPGTLALTAEGPKGSGAKFISEVEIATLSKISGATSPYAQTSLNAGTTYYYVVTALNAAGEGPASAQFSASTSVPASSG